MKHCGVHKHRRDCRKGRPLCALRRRLTQALCCCPAYRFPHREGGGACASLNAVLYGPGPS